jgi:hypothetical protein
MKAVRNVALAPVSMAVTNERLELRAWSLITSISPHNYSVSSIVCKLAVIAMATMRNFEVMSDKFKVDGI